MVKLCFVQNILFGSVAFPRWSVGVGDRLFFGLGLSHPGMGSLRPWLTVHPF
jgi:hypothetical protein